jgi:hypothetical protein
MMSAMIMVAIAGGLGLLTFAASLALIAYFDARSKGASPMPPTRYDWLAIALCASTVLVVLAAVAIIAA